MQAQIRVFHEKNRDIPTPQRCPPNFEHSFILPEHDPEKWTPVSEKIMLRQ
jgi:hypothetical protein